MSRVAGKRPLEGDDEEAAIARFIADSVGQDGAAEKAYVPLKSRNNTIRQQIEGKRRNEVAIMRMVLLMVMTRKTSQGKTKVMSRHLLENTVVKHVIKHY